MIKGYYVPDGYMGYVDGKYRLFANELDYLEYLQQEEQDVITDKELERDVRSKWEGV